MPHSSATSHPDESPERLAELNDLGVQLFQEKLYPQALEVLQQIVELTGRQRSPTDPDLGVALLNRGRVFRLLERNAECEADYQKALEILRPGPPAHRPQVIWLLTNLIALYRHTGRRDQAEPSVRELLAVQRTALGSNDPQLADLLVDLGGVCYERGARAEAVACVREALAIREAAFGSQHEKTIELRQGLAALQATESSPSPPADDRTKTDPTEDQFNECIRGFLREDYAGTRQRAFALIEAGTMTHGLLQMLIMSLQRSGQDDTLAQITAQIPEITRNVPWERRLLDISLGQVEPNTVVSQAQNDEQRGQVFYYTAERMITIGRGEGAAELMSQAVALLPKGLDRILARGRLSFLSGAPAPGHASTVSEIESRVSALSAEANQLHQQGQTREAVPLFEQISELRRTTAGEHDPLYAGTLYDLGAVHHVLGELDKAESYYRGALAIQEATGGADVAAARATRKELAGVLASRGDLDAAAVMYGGVLAEEKQLGAHHTAEWVQMALMLSRFYAARNDHAAVEGLLRDVVSVSRDVHGAQADTTLDALDRLVALLIDRRRFADAQPFASELLDARRARQDTPSSTLADTLDSMAQIAAGRGDTAGAEALWQEALAVSSAPR